MLIVNGITEVSEKAPKVAVLYYGTVLREPPVIPLGEVNVTAESPTPTWEWFFLSRRRKCILALITVILLDFSKV